MLKIKNVTKKFGDQAVIENVSFDVDKGQVVVLLGESGVGKSTLLRLLNNLETMDAGEIILDNKKIDINKVNDDHTIGMVFQHFNLFDHLTVEQNITLALEKSLGKSQQEAHTIAHKLLERFGLADKADSYVSQLSGGQKQRLAIARTLALKPKIICMDEPTSALDPLLTTHVANTIQQLAHEGYIILIATHDTSLLDKLDCTIHLMQAGKIIESTTAQEFSHNKKQFPAIDKFVSGHI